MIYSKRNQPDKGWLLLFGIPLYLNVGISLKVWLFAIESQ